jgi:nitrous oxidase accessory protein NosD
MPDAPRTTMSRAFSVPRRSGRTLLRLGLGLPVVAVSVLLPAAAASAAPATVYVAHHGGTDSTTCGSHSHPCRTISQGVMNASDGDELHVAAGTYHEQVVVPKRLDLDGYSAVIDASGLSSGQGQTMNAAAVLFTPGGSRGSIAGFTVRGAFGEGILVMSAHNVRVHDNRVIDNDLGTPQNTQYGECQAQGEVPGDCGEGVHLMSASGSTVARNVVMDNAGGVLVTDEFGPATGNTVIRNLVKSNTTDCGITLPSHSVTALDSHGVRQPANGGVYGNLVQDNAVLNNGLHGEGAGVLIAAAAPGGAVYNNRIIGNRISGNSMAGVTIHSHTPNQDVSGNVIRNNDIGRNNLLGDPDAGVTKTTGILVFSAVVPQHEFVSGNSIHDNQIAIWTSPNVTLN